MDDYYVLGKYRVEEPAIGRGGFAAVHRALDTDLDRTVALKIFDPVLERSDPDFVARFRREARAAARLRHPHIVTVYEMGDLNGRYYIAMDLIPGPSLRLALAQHGPYAWPQARAVLEQVAAALAYAHDLGVAHRDVKPANILLDPQRGPIVTDFGFARLLGSDASLSVSGGVIGTPAYIPVEVWEGERGGAPADVYALGCLTAELLTGRALFAGETPIAVMRAHDRGAQLPAPWPTPTPPGLNAFLLHALARDPAERFPDAAAFLAALQALEQETDLAATPAVEMTPAAAVAAPAEVAQPAAATPAAGDAPPRTPPASARGAAAPVSPAPARPAAPQAGNATGSRWPVLLPLLALVVLGVWAVTRGNDGDGTDGSAVAASTQGAAVVDAPVATATKRATAMPTTEPTALPSATLAATATAEPSATATRRPTATPTAQPLAAGATRQVALPDGALQVVQVYVPAGPFAMGSDEGSADEQPVHTVTLDAFWIDQTEVTNAQFAAFVAATGYQTTAETEGWGWVFTGNNWEQVSGADWEAPRGPGSQASTDHPVVQVSWDDAVAYCEWRGARLPTEAEWEKAARGTDGRSYPWGDVWDGTRLNYCDANCALDWKDAAVNDGYADTAPVGSYLIGASPYGALDMAGNVWEWTADWYSEAYYSTSPAANPTGPTSGDYRVLRGGSWSNYWDYARAALRNETRPDSRNYDVGFRCANTPF